ncbi:YciI family protein [Pseudonocardia sp.]|uniref:YciI family protein n=1 Tax=Pseudonocardia sp. TaxID=60912 RepID=UPI003D0DD27F
MAQYLLSIQQPDGPPPPPEVLDPIMAALAQVNDDMRTAGVWVFTAGLTPPSSATVVAAKGDEVLVTDGPYVEGKEHVGGFWVIDAPDLDVALHWAGRAARVLTLPVEVRPVAGSRA